MSVKNVIVISAIVAAVALSHAVVKSMTHEARRWRRHAGCSARSALNDPARKRPTEKTMKGAIVLAAVIAAVALGLAARMWHMVR